jgi:hypothetical protein
VHIRARPGDDAAFAAFSSSSASSEACIALVAARSAIAFAFSASAAALAALLASDITVFACSRATIDMVAALAADRAILALSEASNARVDAACAEITAEFASCTARSADCTSRVTLSNDAPAFCTSSFDLSTFTFDATATARALFADFKLSSAFPFSLSALRDSCKAVSLCFVISLAADWTNKVPQPATTGGPALFAAGLKIALICLLLNVVARGLVYCSVPRYSFATAPWPVKRLSVIGYRA